MKGNGLTPRERLTHESSPMVDHRRVPDAPPRWNGWARTGRGKWRLLVRDAATDTEAMEKLRAMTSSSKFIDLCCLPQGRTPFDRRVPR